MRLHPFRTAIAAAAVATGVALVTAPAASAAPGLATTADSVTPVTSAADAVPGATRVSQHDRQYLTKTYQGYLADLRAASLVRARGPYVRCYHIYDFAAKVLHDQQQRVHDLVPVARRLGVRLPQSPTPRQIEELRKLGKLFSGDINVFYKAWLRMQIATHQESIRLAERVLQSGKSPEVKRLAEAAVPILRSHLEELRSWRQVRCG